VIVLAVIAAVYFAAVGYALCLFRTAASADAWAQDLTEPPVAPSPAGNESLRTIGASGVPMAPQGISGSVNSSRTATPAGPPPVSARGAGTPLPGPGPLTQPGLGAREPAVGSSTVDTDAEGSPDGPVEFCLANTYTSIAPLAGGLVQLPSLLEGTSVSAPTAKICTRCLRRQHDFCTLGVRCGCESCNPKEASQAASVVIVEWEDPPPGRGRGADMATLAPAEGARPAEGPPEPMGKGPDILEEVHCQQHSREVPQGLLRPDRPACLGRYRQSRRRGFGSVPALCGAR